MGQGEKSGMTWNFALPDAIWKTPPRPMHWPGKEESSASRMQVTRFFSPVLVLAATRTTRPLCPAEMKRLPSTELRVSLAGSFSVE